MKRIFKMGVIVLILGVILLGIGFFNSGNKAIYFENNRPAIFHSHTKMSRAVLNCRFMAV
ncbi:hypothetical protein ACWAS6_01900 [Limosilactobacillus reuteri]